VLLNNWEATYFDFTTERLLRLAEAGKRIGCDLFVLDDGWFGNRVNDRAGLGDWTQVNETKLPGGLRPLAEGVNALGMRFGLWFEPEMVNVDSDLYRAHPDWCLHVPGRTRTEGRHQLALDVGRAEVREHVWRCLETVLRSAPIGYVKWDMNRHLTEVWAPDLPAHRQGEVAHRYILGVYELFDRLNRTFPDLLIENCASGGGRFDPGMMHYAPQTWCSDNSDAIARLRIQHGTTIAYPPSAVGAHVSIVPNHQVHRTTPLFTRAVVATTGAFGYELDLLRLGDDELARMRALTDRWRELEPLVRTGDLYRLIDPAAGRWAAWMQVAADRGQALVSCVRILAEANAPRRQLRLAGLDATATYRVEPRNETGAQPAFLARGDALMAVGLRLDAGKNQPIPAGDFTACTWHLVRV
jgi:alpha-galactosidase